MTDDRTASAFQFRLAAAELARTREHPEHTANGDEQRYASACYPMSFTKGLEHCGETGLVAHASDFEAFRAAVDDGFVAPFTTRVPVTAWGSGPSTSKTTPAVGASHCLRLIPVGTGTRVVKGATNPSSTAAR
ncbi:MAG: hypothetical protein AAFP22_23095, partial [Planctomycetota bacterium]